LDLVVLLPVPYWLALLSSSPWSVESVDKQALGSSTFHQKEEGLALPNLDENLSYKRNTTSQNLEEGIGYERKTALRSSEEDIMYERNLSPKLVEDKLYGKICC